MRKASSSGSPKSEGSASSRSSTTRPHRDGKDEDEKTRAYEHQLVDDEDVFAGPKTKVKYTKIPKYGKAIKDLVVLGDTHTRTKVPAARSSASTGPRVPVTPGRQSS
jgi:hypothetical protein